MLPSWFDGGCTKALEEVSSAALEDVSLAEDNARAQTNAGDDKGALAEPRAVSELQGEKIS